MELLFYMIFPFLQTVNLLYRKKLNDKIIYDDVSFGAITVERSGWYTDEVTYNAPDGYVAIGLSNIGAGGIRFLTDFRLFGSSLTVKIYNGSAAEGTYTVNCRVILLKI